MKTIKSTLVVITAALLGLALLAAPSSADIGVDDQPTASGNLYQMAPGTTTKITGPFQAGQQVRLNANFPDGIRDVTFYQVVGGTQTVIDTDEAAANGNAYVNYTFVEGVQSIYAEDVNDLETETDPLTGTPAPPPGTNTLSAVETNGVKDGKKFTATFNPATSGQSTKLQVQEICTYETDETNPANGTFDEDVKQADCQGPWTTRATNTQNSAGVTNFTLSDPLEVSHKYRAVSGSTNSDPLTFAAPLPTDPYGIDTGLSELHFNSYEGDSVNTRDHYFEGAFSMTASEKNASPQATQCAQALDGTKTAIMKSVLKGRGNYSWTFPKKSFTLKIDKKLDLCGLGKSKKYALVANDYDKSLLRNSLASFVGQKFPNMGWTPKAVPVEFYVNGSYRGSYILIERIAIQGSVENTADPANPDTLSNRVNIHELNGNDEGEQAGIGRTGGYVMEWDFRKGADYNVYLGSDSGYVGIKEPENDYGRTGSSTGNGNNTGDGISSAHKNYINDHLNDVDAAMRRDSCQSNDWEDFIDKASAVDYYIAMEYMKPVDGNMWASVYMYKPRDGKIKFGPMWDFDLAAGSANRAGNVVSSSGFYLRNNLGVSAQQSSNTWFNCLNKRSSFRNAVESRWNQVITSSFNVSSFIDDQRALIEDSATANFRKWPYSNSISQYQVKKGSWSADVSEVRRWASARKSWLSGSTGF